MHRAGTWSGVMSSLGNKLIALKTQRVVTSKKVPFTTLTRPSATEMDRHATWPRWIARYNLYSLQHRTFPWLLTNRLVIVVAFGVSDEILTSAAACDRLDFQTFVTSCCKHIDWFARLRRFELLFLQPPHRYCLSYRTTFIGDAWGKEHFITLSLGTPILMNSKLSSSFTGM